MVCLTGLSVLGWGSGDGIVGGGLSVGVVGAISFVHGCASACFPLPGASANECVVVVFVWLVSSGWV